MIRGVLAAAKLSDFNSVNATTSHFSHRFTAWLWGKPSSREWHQSRAYSIVIKMQWSSLLLNPLGHEPPACDTYLSFLARGSKGTLSERKGKQERMINSEKVHLKPNLPSCCDVCKAWVAFFSQQGWRPWVVYSDWPQWSMAFWTHLWFEKSALLNLRTPTSSPLSPGRPSAPAKPWERDQS